jgi:hypothetical protein
MRSRSGTLHCDCCSEAGPLNDSHHRTVQGTHCLVVVSFLAFVCTSLSPLADAGIRATGKYSGVVIYDRWGGCILFSGVYLM